MGSFLQSRAPQGVRHQELNAWAIDAVTDAAKRGLLPLKYEVSEPETKTETKTETEKRKRKPRVGVVDQIVGAAGSVALLHPWLVHSGTTNVSTDPRLMANGMVRVRREAFERDGGGRAARLREMGAPFLPGPEPDAEAPSATAAKAADAAVAFGDFSRVADAAEDDAHGVPAKAGMTFEDAPASARAAAAAAAASARGASAASPIDSETPSVSVVVPAHDAARWLDECFASVVAQTYPYSRLEVSAYDDASSDDTETIIKAWARVFSELGVAVAVSGSRWGGEGVATNDASNVARDCKKNDAADAAVALAKPGGIGHGKNAAVRQSTGEVLVFLDADDIMTPHRVQTQVACVLRNKDAIVGGSWRRHPAGSTEHYERWANALPDPAGLWLEQFRETTVQMPTWCLMRATYDKVGGFDEIPPTEAKARTWCSSTNTSTRSTPRRRDARSDSAEAKAKAEKEKRFTIASFASAPRGLCARRAASASVPLVPGLRDVPREPPAPARDPRGRFSAARALDAGVARVRRLGRRARRESLRQRAGRRDAAADRRHAGRRPEQVRALVREPPVAGRGGRRWSGRWSFDSRSALRGPRGVRVGAARARGRRFPRDACGGVRREARRV